MRLIRRMLFVGEGLQDFETAWNQMRSAKNHDMMCGAIAVAENHPDYRKLKTFYDEAKGAYGVNLEHEQIDVRYAETDLRKCEILQVGGDNFVEVDESRIGQMIKEERLCDVCRRSQVNQTGPLAVKLRRCGRDFYYAFHEKTVTQNVGILVSRRFRSFFEAHNVKGVAFREVLALPDLRLSVEYYQILVEPRMGQIIHPTKLVPEHRCGKCYEYSRIGLSALDDMRDRELYFSRQNFDGRPIALTREVVGDQKWINDSRRSIIISQNLYQAIREAGFINFNCITALPAHLV
jgi:hypothetical protein